MQRFLCSAILLLVIIHTVIAQSKISPEDHFNQGTLLLDKKDFDGAISEYDKAIALKPDYINAYFNRGLARAAKGDLDGAVADFDKAIALNPNDARTYTNRGFARLLQGKDQEAGEDFKKAIELNPDLKSAIEQEANKIKRKRKTLP